MWGVEEQRVDTNIVVYYDSEEQKAVWVCEALQGIATYVKDRGSELQFWPKYRVLEMSAEEKDDRKKEDKTVLSKHVAAATLAANIYYDCRDIPHTELDWRVDLVHQLQQTTAYREQIALIHELVTIWLSKEEGIIFLFNKTHDDDDNNSEEEEEDDDDNDDETENPADTPFCILLRRGYGDHCDHYAILGWYSDLKKAKAYTKVSGILAEWDDDRGKGWTTSIDLVCVKGFRYHSWTETWFDEERRGDGVHNSTFCAGKTRVQSVMNYLNKLEENVGVDDVSTESYLDIVTEHLAPMVLEYESQQAAEMAEIIQEQVPEYKDYKELLNIVSYLLHYDEGGDSDESDLESNPTTAETSSHAQLEEPCIEDDEDDDSIQPLPKRVCLCSEHM